MNLLFLEQFLPGGAFWLARAREGKAISG